MFQFLKAIGREAVIVNLDFANDHHRPRMTTPTGAGSVERDEFAEEKATMIDVRDLISLETVMEEQDLGPNGGLIYCMEYLLDNVHWLEQRIASLDSVVDGAKKTKKYLLFDCPGQVELFTHYDCVEKLLKQLTASLDIRLCAVNLIDSFYCSQPSAFIASVLLVSSTMLRLALPHVNVLSKIDLIARYGQLPFQLDFFTEVTDLLPLVRYVDAPFLSEEDIKLQEQLHSKSSDQNEEVAQEVVGGVSKLRRQLVKMSESLCELLTDLGMVSFLPLNIQDGETVGRVLAQIDRANGYSFAAAEFKELQNRANNNNNNSEAQSTNALFQMAAQDTELTYFRSLHIVEKYTATEANVSKDAQSSN